MYTLKNSIETEKIIKNSRFITYLIPVSDKEEVKTILEQIRINYPKATHYCYAYITDHYKKSSDDGEPSGTAGTPILNVLEKEEMSHILAVVIRYFGGIKLGAGGLVRAYSSAVRDALKESQKFRLIEGVRIQISIYYDKQKELDYLLRNSNIIEKKFLDQITYIVDCQKEALKSLEMFSPIILKDIYIEKTDD